MSERLEIGVDLVQEGKNVKLKDTSMRKQFLVAFDKAGYAVKAKMNRRAADPAKKAAQATEKAQNAAKRLKKKQDKLKAAQAAVEEAQKEAAKKAKEAEAVKA